MTDYPEHDKLIKIASESQAIGDFIEWLGMQGIFLARHERFEDIRDPRLAPLGTPWTKLLAEYYEIDLDKIEDEKRAMLTDLGGGVLPGATVKI